MKKNLRLLCLGLAALTFTTSFAQGENVTSKLRNADMEEGIRGWGVDGEGNIFGRNSKSQAARRGFHGVNGGVLENWKADTSAGLTDNSIAQTVKELPAGTYVFGAYVAASLQGTEESNKEEVLGVSIFANEASTPVATDNPDNSAAKWAHTAKFNVATTLAEGADLQVGLKIESTNANFVIWDNATLYYFGNMSEEEALNEMAKIDMAATIAIADTCFAYKMNVDTLNFLTESKAAAQTLATADQLWQLDEDLYWAIYLANRSLGDYRSFNNAILNAEKIAAGDWSSHIAEQVDALNELIATAKVTYDEATAVRAELNEQKSVLNEAAELVALDSCYVILEEITEFIENEIEVGDEIGQYSEAKYEQMNDLIEEAGVVIDDAYASERTARQARHLYDSLYAVLQGVLDNPNSVDSFPFTITTSQEPNADNRYEYTSKVYTVAYPVTNLRFTFKDTFCPNGAGKGDPCFVALGEFYLYDGDGNQIELVEDDFYTNAQEPSEGPMENICDGDISTFWHSNWHNSISEEHYLEITIPEGLELTSFSFGWIDRGNRQNIPLVVEVSSVTTADSDLENALASALGMNAFRGTDPGFYNADLTSFYNAIAAAEALVGAGASDEAIYNAIGVLEEEQGKVDEMQLNMPVAGKSYRLISGFDGFYAKQGVHKAMYASGDTVVWWQNAGADSLRQAFEFEPIANENDEYLFKVKNVATGLYLLINYDDNNQVFLTDKANADTVKLVSLGAGAFNVTDMAGSAIHAGDHNSGNLSTSKGAYGGISGDYSGLVMYPGGFNTASAWYIREMQALPYTTTVAGADYHSESFHLYAGVNTLFLTADKECAFADLTLFDLYGNVIPANVNVAGNVATLMLDTASIESFSFTFTNAEGVASIVVDGNISKLSMLQTAYDEAAAVAPEEGENVMQFKDLSAYNAAMKGAENLLASGGTDEQIIDAIDALQKAVEGLVPNLPEAGKTYYIVSALTSFEETHGVPMMLYASATSGTPRWMYENRDNQNRLWAFEPATVEEGAPAAFYLKNVGTGTYLGSASAQSQPLSMASSAESTVAYNIVQLEGTAVAIAAATNGAFRIHANSHGGGSGKTGNIVYWNSGIETASAWHIYEANAYLTDIDFSQIEDANEQVAPAKKGIYDLFGRRIEAPAATGIYIVDGKKRVIKK